MNHFVLNNEEYVRRINVVNDIVYANAQYLSDSTGKDLEYCAGWVRQQIAPDGKMPLVNPRVLYLEKRTHGNREKYEGTLLGYLSENIDEHNRMISPTLATYERPEVKKSMLVEFTDDNVKERNRYKHAMFESDQRGETVKTIFNNTMQNTKKENNNSLSGAFASEHNAVHNKSGHSSLTSTCRSATSYANATNEKFLMGNRHYFDYEVIIQDLVNFSRFTDKNDIADKMYLFNLHWPSVEDAMECILKSSRKYFNNVAREAIIKDYVMSLPKEVLAAFVYCGDLYHLAKHNPEFVRKFYTEMLATSCPEYNGEDSMAGVDDDTKALVSLCRSDILAGVTLKDLKKDSPDKYKEVCNTATTIKRVIDSYQEFINTFWRAKFLPASIAEFPGVVREAVLTSDTDSTIFTCQYWTKWFTGSINFTRESFAIGYITTYLSSQIVANSLAMMCANLGVGPDMVRKVAMKNEYYFPIYSLTLLAKHYFCYVSAKEGNVYKKFKTDIKGVNLRSSKAPKEITAKLHDYMRSIMDSIYAGKELTLEDVVGPVRNIEYEIRQDLLNGGVKYLTGEQIRASSAYSKGDLAPNYRHYKLWQEVFAPKYGYTEAPPINTFKVSVELDKAKVLEKWIDSLDDKGLSLRLKKFVADNGVNGLTAFQVPQIIAKQSGLPKEILTAMDVRKGVTLIMKPFYIVLEAFGIYLLNDGFTRLLTDGIFEDQSLRSSPQVE